MGDFIECVYRESDGLLVAGGYACGVCITAFDKREEASVELDEAKALELASAVLGRFGYELEVHG